MNLQNGNRKTVYINGYFTKEHINGVPRYATEIIKRLDSYFEPGEVILVIPQNGENVPKLKNIELCTWEDRGRKRENQTVLWGEKNYRSYIKNKNCLNINFTNRAEKTAESITMIHDLITLDNYKFSFGFTFLEAFRNGIYKLCDKIWFYHKVHIKKKYSLNIVTVSEFSKREINRRIGIPLKKINVIGNGWEHILEIESKNEKIDKRIKEKEYFFSIGNLKPHKNFQWVINEAKLIPDKIFVIAGRIPDNLEKNIKHNIPNVITLGYISDCYMKYLMENALALLFPSFVEGFGIPPLEALAIGTPVIASDIPVMHELFENTIGYINPYKQYADLSEILINAAPQNIEKILKKHSWEREVKKWVQLIQDNR